jgi:tetratricopeptide (TPR) repeat protein
MERVELEARVRECAALIADAGDPQTPDEAVAIARALVRQGRALADLRRVEEALGCYEQVGVQFGVSEDPELLRRVVLAAGEAARMLGMLRRYPEADRRYAELLDRFSASSDPGVGVTVARAMYNRAWFLRRAGRHGDALTAVEEFIGRYQAHRRSGRQRTATTGLLVVDAAASTAGAGGVRCAG